MTIKSEIKTLVRYFGGKSFIADKVWKRLGNPDRYIEPFCGSAAVFFKRPNEHEWWNKGELLNDADGFIVNVLRALREDPEQVLRYAVWPKSEVDLHARSAWMANKQHELVEHLLGDPLYYDPRIAGWWLWAMTVALAPRLFKLGKGWVQENGKLVKNTDPRRLGVYRSKPAIAYLDHYFLPPKVRSITFREFEDNVREQWLRDFYVGLQRRLSRTSILCGDWKRVFVDGYYSDGVTTGIFLDPPYAFEDRVTSLYTQDHTDITEEVREWAIAHGNLPHFRIALCGLTDYLDLSQYGWTPLYWQRRGGFENNSGGKSRTREVIWFSPHCLPPQNETVHEK